MNKIFVVMLLVLVTSFILASAYRGQGQQTQPQQLGSVIAQNLSHLDRIVQQKQQEIEQQITQNMAEETKLTIRNQNRVRLAVHSFLAMEDLVGGIGENVSAIAKEFNNSLQATILAEERIKQRSALIRFFAGGDEISSQEIEEEVDMNQERIEEVRRLMENCNCSEEVRNRFEEQVMNLEQEQERLREIAQNEMKSKGLLGWLWK
jgi:DNA-binding transcriptional regulator GbsR (MarR family)